jgi:type I restriction enzyme S subunit
VSFPRYPAYKDSKNDWVAHVPEHWQLVPCRGFVDECTEKNEDAACQSYLSLMANVGIIPYEEKGDIGNKKPEDLSKCKIVHRGDFVINSMNYGIGSYGVSAYEGVCSPVYIVLKPRQDVVESRFAFRVFEDKSFQAYAQSLGNGILAHRCAIGWDDLKGITVGIPPAAEQKCILNFLDHETAKIDALIAEQQRLIELLQEKRQAVISHAVTKGLNPDAPMKDSGVEWLGEVPEHWEVRRLKNLLTRPLQYGANEAAELDDTDLPRFVRITDIDETGRLRDDTFRSLPHDIAAPYLLEDGDVLLARSGATVGKSFTYSREWGSACFAGYLIRARMREVVCRARWLHFYCQTLGYWAYVGGSQIQATIQNVSAEKYANLWLPVPPPSEQDVIMDKLAETTNELENLTAEAMRAIILLQERRSALISAAVTGQIDVRGLAPEASAA